LADLDDFDQPSASTSPLPSGKKLAQFTASKPSVNKTVPSNAIKPNDSIFQQANTNNGNQKQRIVVPYDKFLRVMGRGNCNIKVIQEVTGAQLEVEDKKIPPNQDRSILIRGDSVDMVKYAFELLQALINDSDVDLLNLLPSNPKTPSPYESSIKTNKWATPLAATLSKSVSNYNPLLGGITLLTNKPAEASTGNKPRNFAEVVAKQSISSLNNDKVTTVNSRQISSNKTDQAIKPATSQLSRRHNSVSPSSQKIQPILTAKSNINVASKNNAFNFSKNSNNLSPNITPSNNTSTSRNKSSSNQTRLAKNDTNNIVTTPQVVKTNELNKRPVSIVSPYATTPSVAVAEENQPKEKIKVDPHQQTAQKLLLLPNSILSHPGAPPSAPPIIQNSVPNSSFSSLSSSSSSSSNSGASANLESLNHSIIDSNRTHQPKNLNSLDSFTTTASIIGGLDPIWSFNEIHENSNLAALSKLSQLLPNTNQPSINSNADIINKLSHFINDENFLSVTSKANQNSNLMFNEMPRQESMQPNPSTVLKSKPIGYERHEKQIHNNSNNNNFSYNNNNNNINNNLQFVNNHSNFQNLNQNRNSSLIDELTFPYFANSSNVFEQQQQNLRNFVSPINQKQQNIDLSNNNNNNNNNIDLMTDANKAKLLSHFDSNLSIFNPDLNGFNQNDNNFYNSNSNEYQTAPINNQWMNNLNNEFNRMPFSPLSNQSISNLLLGNSNQINLASSKIGLVPNSNPSPFLVPGVYGYANPEPVSLNNLNQFQNEDQSHIQSQIIDSLKNNVIFN